VYIFYCAGGKFGEVAGVFLIDKHSPDAVHGGTGRWPERPVCCQCLALLGLSTGCTAPDAGCSLFMRPVWPDFGKGCVTESTGCSLCIRWCASGVRGFRNPLCAWVRWAPEESGAPSPVRPEFYKLCAHESGEYQTRLMLTWSRPVLHRWPLEFDMRDSKEVTWPTLEHRT